MRPAVTQCEFVLSHSQIVSRLKVTVSRQVRPLPQPLLSSSGQGVGVAFGLQHPQLPRPGHRLRLTVDP